MGMAKPGPLAETPESCVHPHTHVIVLTAPPYPITSIRLCISISRRTSDLIDGKSLFS